MSIVMRLMLVNKNKFDITHQPRMDHRGLFDSLKLDYVVPFLQLQRALCALFLRERRNFSSLTMALIFRNFKGEVGIEIKNFLDNNIERQSS